MMTHWKTVSIIPGIIIYIYLERKITLSIINYIHVFLTSLGLYTAKHGMCFSSVIAFVRITERI